QATVVLLPDSDGTVGRAIVSNPSGAVELGTSRASTRVVPGAAPEAVTEMSDAEVMRLFGAALAVQPPFTRPFTLYFRFDSEELTDESRKLVGDVLEAVKVYPAPQVTVIGHTDTAGQPASHIALRLRRSNASRTRRIE